MTLTGTPTATNPIGATVPWSTTWTQGPMISDNWAGQVRQHFAGGPGIAPFALIGLALFALWFLTRR